MRISLAIADDLLRTALTDLFEQHGHEVETRHEPDAASDLLVRCSLGPRPRGPRAVLTLRDEAGLHAGTDAAADLERALRDGGEAVWGAPLDPRRLLATLAPGRVPSATEAEALDVPLACSPEAWWLIDSEQRRILDASPSARRIGGSHGDLARGIGRLPWGAHASAVLAAAEGRRATRSPGGSTGVAVWWTPRPGRRVVGWIPAAEDRGAAGGDLHALAELGRLSGTFAHEVRNPLASMASAIDLLKRDLEPGERRDVAALAQERIQHLRAMLDDTLRLVRPFRDPPSAVDLDIVITSALGLARSDPAFASVELALEGDRPLPVVVGHAEPLRQALTNLLLNAIHAQGGRGTVRLHVTRRDGRVLVGVEDEGPGIPAELRERVFEPFWTTKPSGTGLGLAFVRRVAEACGGAVRAIGGARGARLEIELAEHAR
jgi:signal transduction histidine kinase